MTADYPAGVYSPRTKANRAGVVYTPTKTTTGYAEDVSKLDAEVVAIETELGANPKGSFGSVKERLDDIVRPVYVLMMSSATISAPVDTAWYWGGANFSVATSGATEPNGIANIPIPKDGTIIGISCQQGLYGNVGSNEQSNIDLHVNSTVHSAVISGLHQDERDVQIDSDSLEIPVYVGDKIKFKWVAPTWGTNPTSVRMTLIVLIRI
jgi:hypothetical protein